MSSAGQVCPSPDTLLKLVRAHSRASAKLQRVLAEAADSLRAYRKTQEQLEDFLRAGSVAAERPPRGVRFLIEGRPVRLAPALAKVLLALAAERPPRGVGRWQGAEELRARVEKARKETVTRRAIIQAVYRIRNEFSLAGLRAGHIASDGAGKWRLEASSFGVAGIQEIRAGDG